MIFNLYIDIDAAQWLRVVALQQQLFFHKHIYFPIIILLSSRFLCRIGECSRERTIFLCMPSFVSDQGGIFTTLHSVQLCNIRAYSIFLVVHKTMDVKHICMHNPSGIFTRKKISRLGHRSARESLLLVIYTSARKLDYLCFCCIQQQVR